MAYNERKSNIMFAMEHNVEWLISVGIPSLVGLLGTIMVVAASIGKFKDKRMENVIEASATWRELAESREAENKKLQHEIRDCNSVIARKDRQLDFLWSHMDDAKKRQLQSGFPGADL